MINYHSTRGHKETISFEDVILSGVAPDGGLYVPDSVTLENLTYLTQEDLSYEDFVKTIFIALDQSSAKYAYCGPWGLYGEAPHSQSELRDRQNRRRSKCR